MQVCGEVLQRIPFLDKPGILESPGSKDNFSSTQRSVVSCCFKMGNELAAEHLDVGVEGVLSQSHRRYFADLWQRVSWTRKVSVAEGESPRTPCRCESPPAGRPCPAGSWAAGRPGRRWSDRGWCKRQTRRRPRTFADAKMPPSFEQVTSNPCRAPRSVRICSAKASFSGCSLSRAMTVCWKPELFGKEQDLLSRPLHGSFGGPPEPRKKWRQCHPGGGQAGRFQQVATIWNRGVGHKVHPGLVRLAG